MTKETNEKTKQGTYVFKEYAANVFSSQCCLVSAVFVSNAELRVL